MKKCSICLWLALLSGAAIAQAEMTVSTQPRAGSIGLVDRHGAIRIVTGTEDEPLVGIAAQMFAEDVERVSGTRPQVVHTAQGEQLLIVGTLGHDPLVDRLAATGKLKNVDRIRHQWEASLTQVVMNPYPGVKKALVIVGSDRRGTAYGLMTLSKKIGVSPWFWWADVPVTKQKTLFVSESEPTVEKPGVKYRGIFINDEDWGLNQWARKTYDPAFGNIGPRTYEKVFELMLRLRLNYIWPAMHGVSTEFGSVAENAIVADRYGIVVGSSHCEPMLYNNIHWDEKTQGKWDYTINKSAIYSKWEETAKTRGAYEAVWTVGIRGIHDRPMEGPNNILARIANVTQVISDQRSLLNQYVTKQYGPPAQIFVPYKEVLPIYEAGLQVPDDVSLVWADDNFGYIRRLSSEKERQRSGGSGVYYHISYYGGPHSYTWIDTTAPSLMWEELHKAWDNSARTVWVLNVGDIKPMEIGIDYLAQLAWNPEVGPNTQTPYLRSFVRMNFGAHNAAAMTALLNHFYHLGTIRKPELMERKWALSLTEERAEALRKSYQSLLDREKQIAQSIPADRRDAYIELIGFPVRVLGTSGLIFLADRDMQQGLDVAANQQKIDRLRDRLNAEVANFNEHVANGKWRYMMPGLVTNNDLMSWASQVRWPWGEKLSSDMKAAAHEEIMPAERNWRDASTGLTRKNLASVGWRPIDGLGISGHAMALLPATPSSSWSEHPADAPALLFNFVAANGNNEAYLDFLPTFRMFPGMQLRVSVSIDGQTPVLYDVPGASGSEDENGRVRSEGVQNNAVRLRIPLDSLRQGKHTIAFGAVDPGIVIDRVWLP